MPDEMTPQVPTRLFDLTRFLEGHTMAWGIFEDRFGNARRRFTVDMIGHWRNKEFYLDETFRYDDGSSENRIWRVVPGTKGEFSATCADCVGVARGRCDDDTIRMSYRFRLKFNTREITVSFDDRIYWIEEGIAVNRATMSKWGVRLGEVSLLFKREAVAA